MSAIPGSLHSAARNVSSLQQRHPPKTRHNLDTVATRPVCCVTSDQLDPWRHAVAGSRRVGPPNNRDQAVAVLHRTGESGAPHIDTAGYYGPRVANDLICEALHPYPDLVIATKVGGARPVERVGRRGQPRPATPPG